jgi:NADPH2:quinone reductase
MSTTARAVRITTPGGPEVLTLGEIEVADPGPGQVLVEVAAAALNRADLLQRRGLYPAPEGVPADVPGLEYAGRIAARGPGAHRFEVGDPVMGIVGGGGMATYLVAHEREVIPTPPGLAPSEAAAIPEAFLTAYDALFLQAGLKAGETALVHAVASGVGTAATQLIRWAGARVLGTSRSQEKLERCAALGLDVGILVPRDAPAFVDAVREATDGQGAEVILDLVGGPYVPENLRAVAVLGRIVLVGVVGGTSVEVPLFNLLRKRAILRGTVLRARPLEEKIALALDFARCVVPAFGEDGPLHPVIDEVLPMTAIAEAHARMEANRTFGKLVLTW